MSTYINTENLRYPLYEGDIRLAHPNISFPENFVAPDIYSVVQPTAIPTHDTTAYRVEEGAPSNLDGTWVQTWVLIPLTKEEMQAQRDFLKRGIVSRTQSRLDSFAQTRGYDSILSLCTYATDSDPRFSSEGEYGVKARSETWSKLYEILAEAESGSRPIPSRYEDIESDLPTLAWPSMS